MMYKDISTRVEECININTQLKAFGIFVIEDLQEKCKTHMNEFVKNGASQTFVLHIQNTMTSFQVNLVSNANKQSGVVMCT